MKPTKAGYYWFTDIHGVTKKVWVSKGDYGFMFEKAKKNYSYVCNTSAHQWTKD